MARNLCSYKGDEDGDLSKWQAPEINPSPRENEPC